MKRRFPVWKCIDFFFGFFVIILEMLTEKNFLPWKTIDFFGSKLAGKWKNGKTEMLIGGGGQEGKSISPIKLCKVRVSRTYDSVYG